MTDVHNKATRSYNMSRISGKSTKPEILVRKYLFSKGYRYGLHSRKLPGKPDIVLTKYNTVVFINGCFWHGHSNCRYFVVPKTRKKWWLNKINQNKMRDRKNIRLLKKQGWKVITIYECRLKPKKRNKTLNELETHIH